jgi:hypothetical protein
MIDQAEDEIVGRFFSIYDHNWRFYEELLGQAVLVGDALAYCDGCGLYLAAFNLGPEPKTYTATEVFDLIERAFKAQRQPKLRFVNIWGRFEDLPPQVSLGPTMGRVEQSEYFEGIFDSIFDLRQFDARTSPAARKRLRQLRRSPVDVKVGEREAFSHEHFALLEAWLQAHPKVSPVHREFFFTLPAYIKRSNVYVCEARVGSTLVGFSVIGVVSAERMVLHSAFPLRGNGLRAGDALFNASVDFARSRGIRWLHAGYSASPELLQSKEAWGAMGRSPLYREAFYSADEDMTRRIASGRFIWRMRLSG